MSYLSGCKVKWYRHLHVPSPPAVTDRDVVGGYGVMEERYYVSDLSHFRLSTSRIVQKDITLKRIATMYSVGSVKWPWSPNARAMTLSKDSHENWCLI